MEPVTQAVFLYLIGSRLGQLVEHSVHCVCVTRHDLGHSCLDPHGDGHEQSPNYHLLLGPVPSTTNQPQMRVDKVMLLY